MIEDKVVVLDWGNFCRQFGFPAFVSFRTHSLSKRQLPLLAFLTWHTTPACMHTHTHTQAA